MLLLKGIQSFKFNLFLKTDTEELLLMSDGRIFQSTSVGTATEKDLAPYVLKLKSRIDRRVLVMNVADEMECKV